MDDDIDILSALIDEDLQELENDTQVEGEGHSKRASPLPDAAATKLPVVADSDRAAEDEKEKPSKAQNNVAPSDPPELSSAKPPAKQSPALSEPDEKLCGRQSSCSATEKTVQNFDGQQTPSQLADTSKSSPRTKPATKNSTTLAPTQATSSVSTARLHDVDVFGTAMEDTAAGSSEVHTGLTDYESSDDEGLTSTGKEVTDIMKKRELEKRKKENPFKPHMSASEQHGWSTAKTAAVTHSEVQTDPFSGIRVRNPIVSSEALRAKMGGRKMVKIPNVGSYLYKTKDLEEDWVTIGVIVHKSDPKSSNKSGKLFSIVKLGDLQNLETTIQLFLFNDVHMQLWTRLREGRVVGLLNARMLPHREGSQDTALSIDHAGKLLELGDAQDYGTCQGRTKAGQKCSNVVNKSKCTFCVYHVKAEFTKMSSSRPEIQSSYSGAEPSRLHKAVFEVTGGVYGVPKKMQSSMTVAQSRAALRPTGSTNAERKKREQLILSSLELKRKADTNLENMAKRRPGQADGKSTKTPQSSRSVEDEFIETQLKTNGPGARLMRIALGREEAPSNVQRQPNGVITSKVMSPSELLRQHAYRKKVMAFTPTLSGSPGSMVTLGRPQVQGDSKARAARILQGSPIVAENPNAVKRVVDKDRIRKRVETDSGGGQKDALGEGQSKDQASTPKTKRIVLGREVDDEDIKKMMERKSSHQHEVDEAEEATKAAYFSKLERKEELEQKMLSTMSVKVKVVSCPTCRYTAITASEFCRKEGHATKTHEATKRFFRCLDCKNRTVSFCKLPSRSCRRCGGSNWERVAMWSERQGPKLDYEILNLRGEEKKFIDSI